MSWEEKYKSKYPVKGSTIDPKITPKSAPTEFKEREHEPFCLGLTAQETIEYQACMRENLKDISRRIAEEIIGRRK